MFVFINKTKTLKPRAASPNVGKFGLGVCQQFSNKPNTVATFLPLANLN